MNSLVVCFFDININFPSRGNDAWKQEKINNNQNHYFLSSEKQRENKKEVEKVEELLLVFLRSDLFLMVK